MPPASSSTILLDPDIRDWVVLPLFVIMVAAGLLRQSLSILLGASWQNTSRIPARSGSKLRQVVKIRTGAAQYMTSERWQARKEHARQVLQQEADWIEAEMAKDDEGGDGGNSADDPMSAMMNNPMSMMKGSMAFMIQNMVMMQGIQHFFSGFIMLKVPFALTVGFKSMFQRGLLAGELPDLESSYVSSVSWYFLCMYGLRSFLQLATGDPPLEVREQDMRLRQYGMQPQQAKTAGPEDMAKELRQEAENLEVMFQQHKSDFDTVEKRLLGKRYPKKAKVAAEDSHENLFATSSKKKSSSKGKKKTS